MFQCRKTEVFSLLSLQLPQFVSKQTNKQTKLGWNFIFLTQVALKLSKMNKVFKKFLSFLTLTVALFMFVELFFETSRQSAPQIDGDLNNFNVGNLVKSENSQVYTKKKLAVIVPVRNCLRNVLRFVPHMSKFLNAHEIPHHIFMVQQEDLLRFNRAALINIGYLYTKDKFDYSVQHDIDLLPLNPKLTYEFPGDCVFRVMNSFFHPAKGYRNHVSNTISTEIYSKLFPHKATVYWWRFDCSEWDFWTYRRNEQQLLGMGYRRQRISTSSWETQNNHTPAVQRHWH